MEESRLILSCLAITHIAGVAQQTGNHAEAERSVHQLSLAVKACLQWNQRMSAWLGSPSSNGDGGATTDQLRLEQHLLVARAA
jgi:DNA-binding XRE family transcriptional regulator